MDLRLLKQLTLRELSYFVVLAEECNFSKAATRVGIQQSPLSKAIAQLEERLGVKLFHRGRRGTRLTEPGAALLPQAHAILRNAERLEAQLASGDPSLA